MAERRRISSQAMWSDWGKQARSRSEKFWGGRFSDGAGDSKKPASFFGYTSKHRSRSVFGKSILEYPTAYRRKNWKSYGKKY